MVRRLTGRQLIGSLEVAVLYASDDAMTTFYDVPSNANYLQFSGGIGMVGVRYDASASGPNLSVRSMHVRFRKYGLPTGNITVNIRKGVTILLLRLLERILLKHSLQIWSNLLQLG